MSNLNQRIGHGVLLPHASRVSWQCPGRIARTMRLVLFTMYGRLFSTWKRRAFCSLRGVVSRAEGAARESSLGAPQSGWGERCDAEHRNEGKVGGLHWRAPTYRRLRRHFFHRGRRNAPEGARARIDSEVNERRSCRTRACATRPSSVSASSSASPYKSIRKLKLCRFQGGSDYTCVIR
jgi:hypothetical protein